MKLIPPGDLVCMNDLAGREPVMIDLVYAQANHPENVFKTAIYHDCAKLWLHTDLAAITVKAAQHLKSSFGYTLVLKDGLRPVEAQAKVWETDIMKAHPEWAERHLFARPGMGGHPRGMAIDVSVLNADGSPVDMGVPFDYFSEDPDVNPAARDYTGFPANILKNRQDLESAFVMAAESLGLPLYPLHSEWWDFRFPKDIAHQYAPIYDADLPEQMRMMNT
jgi:D-alanyl-D-alanine dipeptidase